MKTISLRRSLTAVSALALVVTLTVWVGTGAHWGWTRTQTVRLQQDAVTGIEYPVHVPTFVAGVEVLAAGLAITGALATVAAFIHRPVVVRLTSTR